MKRTLALIILLFYISTFCQETLTGKLHNYFTALTQLRKFNGNVLVARGSGILLERSYNISGQPEEMYVSHDSRFIIASVSKLFVKFSILKLAEENNIALDDPVGKFFPGFAPDKKSVTVGQLINHTSGFPRELFNYDNYDHLTLDQIVELASREKLQFQPGSDTLYSNIAYFLLDKIIDIAGTGGYPGYIEKNIFSPMNMRSTGEYLNKLPGNTFVNGFGFEKGNILPVEKESIYRFETGNYYSTMEDLYAFSQNLFSGRILSKSFASMMLNSDSCVVQAGGRPGYRAYFYKDLKSDETFILLSNFSEIPMEKIIKDVPDIIAGIEVPVPKEIERTAIPVSRNTLQQFVGTYELEADPQQIFKVAVENDLLVITDKSGERTVMKADSDTTFFSDPHTEDGLAFILNPQKNNYNLVIIMNGIKWKTRLINK